MAKGWLKLKLHLVSLLASICYILVMSKCHQRAGLHSVYVNGLGVWIEVAEKWKMDHAFWAPLRPDYFHLECIVNTGSSSCITISAILILKLNRS